MPRSTKVRLSGELQMRQRGSRVHAVNRVVLEAIVVFVSCSTPNFFIIVQI
jgi:hypothetical protein